MRNNNQLKDRTLSMASLYPNWLGLKPCRANFGGQAPDAEHYHHAKLTALALGLGFAILGLIPQPARSATSTRGGIERNR